MADEGLLARIRRALHYLIKGVDPPPRRDRAADPFEGDWQSFRYTGPAFMADIFPEDAQLSIRPVVTGNRGPASYEATLTRGSEASPLLWDVDPSAEEKIIGEFSAPGDPSSQRYYFEITPPTPPSTISPSNRCIYGIVAPMVSGPVGDDLGDPGAWESDDDGGLGGGGIEGG